MPKYDPSAPPKRVRKDKPGDSPKNYLNPFRTLLKASAKKKKKKSYG